MKFTIQCLDSRGRTFLLSTAITFMRVEPQAIAIIPPNIKNSKITLYVCVSVCLSDCFLRLRVVTNKVKTLVKNIFLYISVDKDSSNHPG